jgi:beta-lactam-binding protein with PASTA domain
MAEVYRGHDPVLNRTVAVKILLPQWAQDSSFVSRFRREAQAAARLNHPNVVAVYDSGSDDHTQWIVMEYIEGRTLHDFLADGRRGTPIQSCEIATSICRALASAHAQGVIHRDIKPANVMVTRDGTVKLMDLGIARMVTGPETAPQTSAILGTASYMSPEQAQGQPVDERTDLYSTGAVLYELLTGSPPHTGDSPVAIAYKQVNEVPPPPSSVNPDVTPALDAVVMRALAKNPANRYQTAAEFAEDLERVRTGQEVLATPLMAAGAGAAATQLISRPQPTSVLPPHEEPEGSGRKVWLGVLIGALVLAILAAGGFFLASYLTDEPNPQDVLKPVPSVLGETEEEATRILNEAGFEDVTVEREAVDNPDDVGLVIRQDPLEDSRVDPANTEVTITIGRRQTAEVPTLTGLTQSEAEALLQDSGLTLGSVTEEASEQPVGVVISQNPLPFDRVPTDTAVDIVLSSGPGSVMVPDVECRSFTSARNMLERAGLVAVQSQEAVPANPLCPRANKVAVQDPSAGTEVPSGSTVTLYFALAPSPAGEE